MSLCLRLADSYYHVHLFFPPFQLLAKKHWGHRAAYDEIQAELNGAAAQSPAGKYPILHAAARNREAAALAASTGNPIPANLADVQPYIKAKKGENKTAAEEETNKQVGNATAAQPQGGEQAKAPAPAPSGGVKAQQQQQQQQGGQEVAAAPQGPSRRVSALSMGPLWSSYSVETTCLRIHTCLYSTAGTDADDISFRQRRPS
jgi:hypothetical protein